MSGNSEGFGFAGPTLYGLRAHVARDQPDLSWLPPVQRGDVARLVDAEPPQLMVIVDGHFHNCLSVAHREILGAVDAGWEVWGLSSMGAIRAYELRDFGVRGFGEVYRRFFLEEDFRDDEVALLHESQPPFRSFSEPLVHIRVAMADLVAREVVSETSARRIVEALSVQWFGERTLERLRAMVEAEVPPSHVPQVRSWLSEFARYRIKSHDLEDFIASRWGPGPTPPG